MTTTPQVRFRTSFAESMRYVRRYPEELPELAELLPQIATPVAIVDAGHFVREEALVEYASIVIDSITGLEER